MSKKRAISINRTVQPVVKKIAPATSSQDSRIRDAGVQDALPEKARVSAEQNDNPAVPASPPPLELLPFLFGSVLKDEVNLLFAKRDKASGLQPVEFDLDTRMYLAAQGSDVAQSLLTALKHEGKPSTLNDEQYLNMFAGYGWDEEADEQAREVLRLWKGKKTGSNILQDDLYPLDPFETHDDYIEGITGIDPMFAQILGQADGTLTTAAPSRFFTGDNLAAMSTVLGVGSLISFGLGGVTAIFFPPLASGLFYGSAQLGVASMASGTLASIAYVFEGNTEEALEEASIILAGFGIARVITKAGTFFIQVSEEVIIALRESDIRFSASDEARLLDFNQTLTDLMEVIFGEAYDSQDE